MSGHFWRRSAPPAKPRSSGSRPKPERDKLVGILKRDLDPEALTELDEEVLEDVLDQLDSKDIAAAARELEADDAATILEDLPEEERREVLAELPAEERAVAMDVAQYKEAHSVISLSFTRCAVRTGTPIVHKTSANVVRPSAK